MKLSLAVLFLLSFILIAATFCHASDGSADVDSGAESDSKPDTNAAEESAFEIPNDAVLLKMKVRELKEILGRKGPNADCLACTSKREYVDRIHETESWPDVTPSATPPEPDLSKEEMDDLLRKAKDPNYMADLRKKLEEAGIDSKNIFSGKDFDPSMFKDLGTDDKKKDDSKTDESTDNGNDSPSEESEL